MAASVIQAATKVNLNGVTASSHSISFASTPAAGNAALMSGHLTFGSAISVNSVTDNQTGNTYTLKTATNSESSNQGRLFAGYDTAVNASGTFTCTVNLSASAACWGVIGALEIADIKDQAVNADGSVSSFNITSNDVNVSTSGATTAANCFIVATVGLNPNFAALTMDGASGYANRYDENASGSYPGWSLDTQSVTATGVQSCQWAHQNGSYTTAGAGIILAFEEAAWQRVYPTTDTTRDNWEENDGTTDDLKGRIDEVTADDADYIRTQTGPSSDVYVTKFGSLTDPSSSTGHRLSVRYGKDAAAGDTIGLVAELRQGYTSEGATGTLIATALSNENINSGWTQLDYDLSSGEANNISDYTSLYLRLVGNREAVGYSTTPPTYRGAGGTANQFGTTSVLITAVTSNAEGDVLLIVLESSDSTTAAGTPNTPANWSKIFEQTSGGGGTGVTTLTIFARLAPAGGSGNVTVDGVGDHCGGRMFAVTAGTHGVADVTTDINVGTRGDHGTSTTNLVTPELSGLVANSLIFWCIGLSDDANDSSNASGYTNANFASISERTDGTSLNGAGGGVAVATATCAGTTTGNAGNWDHDTAERSQSMYLAIRPALAPRRAQVSWARFQVPEATNPDVTVTVSGVAGSGAAGTITITGTALVEPVGAGGTGAAGTVTVSIIENASTTLTGTAGTGAAGALSFTTTAQFTLAGVAGAGAAGEVLAEGSSPDVTVALAGVSGAGAAGTATVAVSVSAALAGVAGTGAGGTATITGTALVIPAGIAGTGAAGTAAATGSAVLTLTGAAGTGAAGTATITGTARVIPDGIAATGQAGEVSAFGDTADALASPVGVAAAGAVGAAAVQIEDAAAPAPEAPRGGSTITILVPKPKRPPQARPARAAAVGVTGRGAAGRISVLTQDWVEDDEIMLLSLVA